MSKLPNISSKQNMAGLPDKIPAKDDPLPARGSRRQSKPKNEGIVELNQPKPKKAANVSKMATYTVDCPTTSTQFMKEDPLTLEFHRITRMEYEGISETISRSSDTYHCTHLGGKVYSEKGLLKRNLIKELDPKIVQRDWIDPCHPLTGDRLMEMMMFLVSDDQPSPEMFEHRWSETLEALCKYTEPGYNIRDLDSICLTLNYLLENTTKYPFFKTYLARLYGHMRMPILMTLRSDADNYSGLLQSYFTFVDYILATTVDDGLFELAVTGLQRQLSLPDAARGPGCIPLATAFAFATTAYQTTTRMLAVCADNRFSSFLSLANLLAMNSADNCLNMMKDNILENIFYRFNPYFPNAKLSSYEVSPYEIHPSSSIQLGAASEHLSNVLSLILVLIKTTIDLIKENPALRHELPHPDSGSQICFTWGYRYECRAPDHRHQRNTMTAVILGLMSIYGARLETFNGSIMNDVLSMAVMSEVKPRLDWLAAVPFSHGQEDVLFKQRLISLSLVFLKEFPMNLTYVETLHWVHGLMYLLDPGLAPLRTKWSTPLFAVIRKTAMQGLLIALPMSRQNLVKQYGFIRRLLWYIEWYPESPYDLTTLYWCVRLLLACLYSRDRPERRVSVQEFFQTHGVVILMHLCNTLLNHQQPPVEKSQCIISCVLRIFVIAAKSDQSFNCLLYPGMPWPKAIAHLAERMSDVVAYSVTRDVPVSDRWIVSLLNFIWETVVWNDEYRKNFLKKNGIYKLLDMIPKISSACQCIALGLICDIAVAGDSISQLITWRAKFNVSFAQKPLIYPGSTIAALLAAIFRDECREVGIELTEEGILRDIDLPMVIEDFKTQKQVPLGYENLETVRCNAAASIPGSRLPKIYAILELLSRDLDYKVSLLDEAYNLYKSVKLSTEDEIALIAVSHFMTIKLNEAWQETRRMSSGLAVGDDITIDEFVEIGRGWTREIIRQQQCVVEAQKKKELGEESSLYEFLSRIRLNTALDALQVVRQVARSTDRQVLIHERLHDAVHAHQRLQTATADVATKVMRTYQTPLDVQGQTGQHVRVQVLRKKTPTETCAIVNNLSGCQSRKAFNK